MSDVAVATAADGDALSPAEEAYFASAGEKLDGLDAGEGEQTAEPADAKADQAEEKAAEAKEADAEKVVEGKDKQRTVPHGAFHEERERRKALEAELRTERDNRVRLNERLDLLNRAIQSGQQTAQKADEPPDMQQDPFGYIQWQSNRLAELEGKTKQVSEAWEAQQQSQRVLSTANAFAMEWSQQNGVKDWDQALQHLRMSRAAELEAWGLDRGQILDTINREELQAASQLLQMQRNPGEWVYNMAKLRGYRPPEATQDQSQQAVNGAGNGQDKSAEAAKALEQIQKGQQAAKTLSGGGTATDGPLTAEALLAMSDDEFAAFEAKLSPAQRRQYFG